MGTSWSVTRVVCHPRGGHGLSLDMLKNDVIESGDIWVFTSYSLSDGGNVRW